MADDPEVNERIYHALEDAYKQGLPLDWTLTIDKNGKKRWVGPEPDCKSFSYLQRALEYVKNATSSSKKRRIDSEPASTGQQNGESMKKKKAKSSKNSAAENSEDVESDPETSLDLTDDFDVDHPRTIRTRLKGTVHWNPQSPEGQRIGHRIRIWCPSANIWKKGRVVRYDPISHKHKVLFFSDKKSKDDEEVWLYLDKENIQLAGRFVWALVKGFAWWPAQVLYCNYPNPMNVDSITQPKRAGYELVEFFGTNEVANIKIGLDSLRNFNGGAVDEVIEQNKRKRNPEAIKEALQEEEIVNEVRNDASKFYAEKAFSCTNAQANYLLGAKVEVFRGDLNYPKGEHLIGTVRLYSTATKKYLVSYEQPPINKTFYEANWLNLSAVRYKVLDEIKGSRRRFYTPSDDDVFPFFFDYNKNSDALHSKCRGCMAQCDKENESTMACSNCYGIHHPGCLDPPLSEKAAKAIVQSKEKWLCKRCVKCTGCREYEITQGTETVATPSSLFLNKNETLNLCVSCVPLYDKKQFCPICAHAWDDSRYNKIQSRLKKNVKSKNGALCTEISAIGIPSVLADTSNTPQDDTGDDIETSFRWRDSRSIENRNFYAENDIWGFNESIMLCCEKCNLWVHAGCAELSKFEYDQTTTGVHPIYSSEYLCRVCCRDKALSIMKLLMDEDKIFLFASPVTDQVAHNYRDIIKEPMDLQTMSERAFKGDYKNYAWIREAFELMVYNALVFNPPQSKYWLEAKRFYHACIKHVFKSDAKGAPESNFGILIKERFSLAEQLIQAEKDRVKTDETAEKKDLVAGSDVLVIDLGPLIKPADPPSCIPTTVVRLNEVDAFYASWMECCFSCGSSGAIDTMLFCVDCGEAYHSFCASAPIHSMNAASISGWRCPNCKLCEISGQVTDDETKLLYCEMCDRAFSIERLSPPLDKVPAGIWVCGQCVDCKKCDNSCDKGKASRVYWSRNPSRCLPCGGCCGLSLPSLQDAKCSICLKFSRNTDGLPQCSDCKSFIHSACDPNINTNDLSQYRCPPCVNGSVLKEKEDSKSKTLKMKLKTNININTNLLSEEDRLKKALIVAMQDAKRKGLPEGWQVFYGNSKRKKWRSPPPESKTFNSVPKALEYVEKMKRRLTHEDVKQEEVGNVNEESVHFFPLHLESEPEWILRERGYDESTSLMSDAEVLMRILECKLDLNLITLFDPLRVYGDTSPTNIRSIPTWELARAGRFIRFVKRLRERSLSQGPKMRDEISTKNAQLVVCKMASAFIKCVCIMFQVDLARNFSSFEKVHKMLVPVLYPGLVELGFAVKPKSFNFHQQPYQMHFNQEELRELAYLQLHAAAGLNTPFYQLVLEANTSYNKNTDIDSQRSASIGEIPIVDPSTKIAESLVPSKMDDRVIAGTDVPTIISAEVCDGKKQHHQNGKILSVDEATFAFKSMNELDIVDALMMLNGLPSRTSSADNERQKQDEITTDLFHIDLNNRATDSSKTGISSDIEHNDLSVLQRKDILMKDRYHLSENPDQDDVEDKSKASTKPEVEHEELQIPQEKALPTKQQSPLESSHPLINSSIIEDSLTGLLQLKHSSNSCSIEKMNPNHSCEKCTIPDIVKSDKVATITSRDSCVTPKSRTKLPWFSKDILVAEPMKGWNGIAEENTFRKWVDSRTCCLCAKSGDSDFGLSSTSSSKYADMDAIGRLLPLPGGEWIHCGCAIWSSEVWEEPAGGLLHGIAKARSRGSKLRCFGCGQYGATAGCHRSNCSTNYHFPCAKFCGSVFTESLKMYCSAHRNCSTETMIEFEEPMKILRVSSDKCDIKTDLCYRSGSLVVHSLGKIQVDCDGFHSRDYITPPGFCSTRIFWSFKKPKSRVLYFMKIARSASNKPIFTLSTSDSPSETFQNNDVNELYKQVMKKVWDTNCEFFSQNDLLSIYPMARSKNNKNAFGLNGPQFFGYGVDFIREALELQNDAIACAAPLSKNSVTYKFCFHKPTEQAAMDLQRRRAVIKAEKALENVTGSARTEGSSAFDKSKGSGRITRALVRSSNSGSEKPRHNALTKGGTETTLTKGSSIGMESELEMASTQAKYDEMKAVPMEERLEAKRSHIHGWGLFAKKNYPKNSMIAEYMGETIGQPIADKREKMYEISGEGSCYMFRLDLHEIVDATKVGCMARFMNHCCSANAYAKIITVTTELGTEKKIVVFANQDINSGEEITYDYKFPVEDGSLRCTCGAPNCIGRMN